jgi:hypothetical protein
LTLFRISVLRSFVANPRPFLQWHAAILCSSAFVAGAAAQGVLAPPPPDFTQKTLVPPPPGTGTGTNQFPTTPLETTAAAAGPSPNRGLLDWGGLFFHPHPLYRFSYGNGIQAQPGQQSQTAINEFAPGFLVGLGNHWSLDYTPTLRFYSNKLFRDTTDHAVALSGGTTYADWTFGLSQSYVSSSEPLIETASQTDTATYSTGLNATWRMSTKTSLELGASQSFRYVAQGAPGQQLSDSQSWQTLDWLNYQMWPRFDVAVGVGFGYDALKVSSDMTSEQLQGRINLRGSERLTFSLNAGLEDRQFLNSSQSASLTPIFSLTLAYHLFEPTTLSLIASRTVSPSYFQSQLTEATGFTCSVEQRLLRKLFLTLSGSYGNSTFQTTTAGLVVDREDNHTNIDLRLTYPFWKQGSASVFYDWSDNSSNQSGFGYTSNQVGLELGYRF